mmetsp:Transcript_26074/g.77711  ORF Transcript_26074/g.77711 Transcript_26074/m.77711 type:complete len:211 (+) Transcript_26074:302-934(+)
MHSGGSRRASDQDLAGADDLRELHDDGGEPEGLWPVQVPAEEGALAADLLRAALKPAVSQLRGRWNFRVANQLVHQICHGVDHEPDQARVALKDLPEVVLLVEGVVALLERLLAPLPHVLRLRTDDVKRLVELAPSAVIRELGVYDRGDVLGHLDDSLVCELLAPGKLQLAFIAVQRPARRAALPLDGRDHVLPGQHRLQLNPLDHEPTT